MIKKIIFLIAALSILLSVNVSAVDMYGQYNVPVDIDVNGNFIKCVQKPILIDGTTYIPLRAFSDAIGGTVGWDETEKGATMIKDGHTFVFCPDKEYCTVDGEERNYNSVLYKDLTFIPVRAVSDVLGYNVLWDDFYLTVKITAPEITVLDEMKDYTYTYEDILYLGKITQIESGYQAYDVKIGVAATIVNRVNSSLFPDTVKDVVFDTKYGVQFPPVHTDRINVTPTKETVMAAKCALFGIKPTGNSLYFIESKNAKSSWAHRNRPFFGTLGAMSFYE